VGAVFVDREDGRTCRETALIRHGEFVQDERDEHERRYEQRDARSERAGHSQRL
jgi:hypothetical protein